MERKIFAKAKELIKQFEGLSLKAYKDPAGYWTIGYGHLIKSGEKELLEREITKEEAERILEADMYLTWRAIRAYLREIKLEEMHYLMWAAVLSFCFNVGVAPLKVTSGFGKAIRSRDFRAAADEFLKWVKAGGKVLRGLVRRREKEREVFLEGLRRLEAGELD